jgi:DnaJ-class molecular chaperone
MPRPDPSPDDDQPLGPTQVGFPSVAGEGETICTVCGGSGRQDDGEPCPACGGSGREHVKIAGG